MRLHWIGGASALALVLAGCGRPTGPVAGEEPPAPVAVTVGTPVTLVLLQALDSGGAEVGARVALMVAEDVSVAGAVAIPRGAPAEGVVVQSRAAGTLSALANTPARLSIRVERVWAPDGSEVQLCSDVEAVDEPYQFTRDNTGRIVAEKGMDELWSESDAQRLLSQLAQDLEEGRSLDLKDPEVKRTLGEAAEKLGMASTARLLQNGEIERASNLIDQLRKGGTATALLSGASATTVGAAMELVGLAGSVGSRVSGMLKGRNIKAHVGTPVEAYVAESTTLPPVAQSRP